MDTLYKQFQTDVKTLPDSRSVTFLISTDAVDRDGDSIDPTGWDLKNYQASPVVLWSHDHKNPPIAKTTRIEQTKNGLSATAEFPAKGIYPFADTVYELLKGGFLNASSVGFRPIESEQATDRKSGMNFMKQELLEWSVVPIPANPDALIQFSASAPEHKQIAKAMADWAEKYLGDYFGERGVYLPAAQIEKAFEAMNKSGVLKAEEDKLREQRQKDYDEFLAKSKEMDEAAKAQLKQQTGDEHLEIAEQDELEIDGEFIEVDMEAVHASVTRVYVESIKAAAVAEAVRQINYARGRVT